MCVFVWACAVCGMVVAGCLWCWVLGCVELRDATLHGAAVRRLHAQAWRAACVLPCLALWWVCGFLRRRGGGSALWREVALQLCRAPLVVINLCARAVHRR